MLPTRVQRCGTLRAGTLEMSKVTVDGIFQ